MKHDRPPSTVSAMMMDISRKSWNSLTCSGRLNRYVAAANASSESTTSTIANTAAWSMFCPISATTSAPPVFKQFAQVVFQRGGRDVDRNADLKHEVSDEGQDEH